MVKAKMLALAASFIIMRGLAVSQMPDTCLNRLATRIDELIAKNPPQLFAWHLRSLKAIAEAEYAKLKLNVDQSPDHKHDLRSKEFVEYTTAIANGLDSDECSDPNSYLRDGKRTLVLARPSALDGTLQYTLVDLPMNWDPSKTYPLFVGLHGSGPDNPLAYPSFTFTPTPGPAVSGIGAPAKDMIRLGPWGRGNRGWLNDAERDLFEAIDCVKSFAKLDRDRWYVTGHSSGGDGAWALIMRTPDLWAAAGIQSGSMVSGRPDWGLLPNLAQLPVHILVGAKDTYPERVSDSKEAYEILRKMGNEAKLVVLPETGHYPLTPESVDEQTAWLIGHSRRRPDHFSFRIDQAAHSGIWGVSVPYVVWSTRLILAPWPEFTCDIRGQAVSIETKRVKALRVDFGPKGLGMAGDVSLKVNGRTVYSGAVPDLPIDIKEV